MTEQDELQERRRERRFEQTREEILAAAREAMMESGAARLSLREVARRAGFSPGALYNYFSGRQEILAGLAEQSFELLGAALRRVPADLPPDARLVELGMAYLRFAADNPEDLQCIVTVASEQLSPELSPMLESGLGLTRLLSETLQEGVAAGVFRGLPSDELPVSAFSLWSLVHGMATLAGTDLHAVQDQVRRDPRRVLEQYVDGLRRRED